MFRRLVGRVQGGWGSPCGAVLKKNELLLLLTSRDAEKEKGSIDDFSAPRRVGDGSSSVLGAWSGATRLRGRRPVAPRAPGRPANFGVSSFRQRRNLLARSPKAAGPDRCSWVVLFFGAVPGGTPRRRCCACGRLSRFTGPRRLSIARSDETCAYSYRSPKNLAVARPAVP